MANPTVKIETNHGTIEAEMFADVAPRTAGNFIELAKKGFYDGVIFHRVIEGFMIQGGDPTGTGRGGPGYTIDDEFAPGLAHTAGRALLDGQRRTRTPADPSSSSPSRRLPGWTASTRSSARSPTGWTS